MGVCAGLNSVTTTTGLATASKVSTHVSNSLLRSASSVHTLRTFHYFRNGLFQPPRLIIYICLVLLPGKTCYNVDISIITSSCSSQCLSSLIHGSNGQGQRGYIDIIFLCMNLKFHEKNPGTIREFQKFP